MRQVLLFLLQWFFQPFQITSFCAVRRIVGTRSVYLGLSDWSGFQAIEDDDDDILGFSVDKTSYAVEEDSQEKKAFVGESLDAPEIEVDTAPIQVPAGTVRSEASLRSHRNGLTRFYGGSQLELTEDTVLGVLSACRLELGTLFGYSAENRGVGITGGVDYVDLDGPCVIIRLKGRFWHQRTTVLDRVANYLQQRIPEIIDVQVEDPYQLTDKANEEW